MGGEGPDASQALREGGPWRAIVTVPGQRLSAAPWQDGPVRGHETGARA